MIKVVMDSTCGMTVEDFEKAGMVMVPLYIREGEKLYTIYIKDKEDETNE